MPRLKKNIIKNLSKNIRKHLKEIEELKIYVSDEILENEIFNIIQEDINLEEEIEKEAKSILEDHQTSISMRSNISYRDLLIKSKKIIAKQKGFIL